MSDFEFNLDYTNETHTTSSGSATITFPDGGPRWRVPWGVQIRYFIDLVWTKGWATVWAEGLWWREVAVEVETQ